jgi:general secretion pathway protein C
MSRLKTSNPIIIALAAVAGMISIYVKSHSPLPKNKLNEIASDEHKNQIAPQQPIEQKNVPDAPAISVADLSRANPSQLPILVIGTLITSDPKGSIASLYIKTKKFSDAYITGTNVSDLATIVKIERSLVYLKNKSNSNLEYLKLNSSELFQYSSEINQSKDVQNTGPNSYSMSKASLSKYLNDLSTTLMTATVIPNKDNNSSINGFKFVDMLPMGIFEQLGFKKNDIIKGVNGETIDSLQKAMEAYNNLKNSNGFKIQIERNGKSETLSYGIN